MEHGKESIIYHLTEKQSLAINRVGIIPAESDSPIDIYNMQLPQDIAEHIITYFNGIVAMMFSYVVEEKILNT